MGEKRSQRSVRSLARVPRDVRSRRTAWRLAPCWSRPLAVDGMGLFHDLVSLLARENERGALPAGRRRPRGRARRRAAGRPPRAQEVIVVPGQADKSRNPPCVGLMAPVRRYLRQRSGQYRSPGRPARVTGHGRQVGVDQRPRGAKLPGRPGCAHRSPPARVVPVEPGQRRGRHKPGGRLRIEKDARDRDACLAEQVTVLADPIRPPAAQRGSRLRAGQVDHVRAQHQRRPAAGPDPPSPHPGRLPRQPGRQRVHQVDDAARHAQGRQIPRPQAGPARAVQPAGHLLPLVAAVLRDQRSDPLKVIDVGGASFIDLTPVQATGQPRRTCQVHAHDSTAPPPASGIRRIREIALRAAPEQLFRRHANDQRQVRCQRHIGGSGAASLSGLVLYDDDAMR
jgi:hypothetical protein